MNYFASIKFACKKCGGLKTVGERYYALGEDWVDITCVRCSDSKDISVYNLIKFLERISRINDRVDYE